MRVTNFLQAPLRTALAVLALLAGFRIAPAAETSLLWQIGDPDRSFREFALAPGDYLKFKQDAFFIPDESDTKTDWPYIHPGPDDAWAGSRDHTFIVLFGLKNELNEGSCRLVLDLLDAHRSDPPTLKIEINGEAFERQVAPGSGEEPGRFDRGQPSRISVDFPAGLLRKGDNQVRITTTRGSWMLYDAIGLDTPSNLDPAKAVAHTVVTSVKPIRAMQDRAGKLFQPIWVTVRHIGPPITCVVRPELGFGAVVQLERGSQIIPVLTLAVTNETSRKLEVLADDKPLVTQQVTLQPVRQLTVYILPHSHTDIGYTESQAAVAMKQTQNITEGIAAAKKTATFPAGARFVWNVEVAWAAEQYLNQATDAQKQEFFEAIKNGQLALNGLYLNELTGLCRPEELIRLFRPAQKIADQCGVTLDSAMLSDVPGATWGTVTAMAQAGIKYFSTAPNNLDRIGSTLKEWENKPFYWVGPDGQSKVLVWVPYLGYALSHRFGHLSGDVAETLQRSLDDRKYPYDIACIRWSGQGDNATPDPDICTFVASWNDEFKWPHFVISSTHDAFSAFEKRYGDSLPKFSGDWTPYWEDGAGSSAFETSVNRTSADRLTQAEALFAMNQPKLFPAAEFDAAWKNILLYSEHTWGAWSSVRAPERPESRSQWETKRGYTVLGDRLSHDLFSRALPAENSANSASAKVQAVDIWNTTSWSRTGVVLIPALLSKAGDRALDEEGEPVPSQRLASGELAVMVRDVPAFAARRYGITAGKGQSPLQAVAEGNILDNGLLHVRVAPGTGAIVELKLKDLPDNFADTSTGEGINDYLYLLGDELKNLQRNGTVTIRSGETGPLVASLIIDSAAPGCKTLSRELRVTAGFDTLEIINRVNKERLKAKSYEAKEGKESVHFAFPFAVPGGEFVLETPLGFVRPETDQIPGACKNWLEINRWADVSNKERGITWVSLDAPLIELGGISANLLNSQAKLEGWRSKIGPTQRLYSWAMNNHWHTNYRPYQEGPTEFRFILRPHRQFSALDASRLAGGAVAPLLAISATGAKVQSKSILEVSSEDVLVSGLKPADAGKGLIARLFNTATEPRTVTLKWQQKSPKALFMSGTNEKPGTEVNQVMIPAHGLVTVLLQPEG